MSIQNTRVERMTELLLKKNLQKGILPDSQEFIWQLNQALRDTSRDAPSFRFRPYQNTEIFRSEKYNQDNTRIHQDLGILYENIVYIHGMLDRHFENFGIEKEKLEKQIDLLENRLRQFVQNAGRAGLLPYAYETFDNTEKVDLTKTSGVFVDTAHNGAYLVEEKNTSRRITPSGQPSFRLYPDELDKKEETLVGTLSAVLTDEADKSWQRQVLLKETQTLTGVIEIPFQEKLLINRVELEVFTVQPFSILATYTPDGSSWYHLPYYPEAFEMTKRVVLDFPSLEMKAVRLIMTKTKADENLPETDGYDYQYLFGFQHIAFYQKSYPTSGVLYSKALRLENSPDNYALQAVSLHADEYLPTGTDIRYEVALKEEVPDWQPISPMGRKNPSQPTEVLFSRLTKDQGESLFFPSEYAIRQSEAEDLRANSIPLYRLSSIQNEKSEFFIPPYQIVEGTPRLYVGKNSWSVTSFPSDNVEGIPNLTDYQSVQDGTVTEYHSLGKNRNGEILKNVTAATSRKYLARIGFYLERARTIQASPASTDPLAVYVNGELLYEGIKTESKSLYYVFKPGWNEIVVLLNGKNATTVNGITATLGFNPSELSQKIYSSSKAMKQISVFDLQYNTKVNDRTVFAMRETGNGLEVLTNFASPGLAFDLLFDYKDDSLPEEDEVLFRATLERENGENIPTPILRSYRLEFT